MARPSEFTREAKADINDALKNKRYRIGTLLASMYLQTRLATLIRRSLRIDDANGRRRFRNLFETLTLGHLLSLAHRSRMFTKSESNKLSKFLALRNDVAHDLEMKGLDKKTKDAIEHWCNWVIEFMEITDGRNEPIRKTSTRSKPGYLVY